MDGEILSYGRLDLAKRGIEFSSEPAVKIDAVRRQVRTSTQELDFDFLIVAVDIFIFA